MKPALRVILSAFALGAVLAAPAQAESAYGCANLDGRHRFAAVEGRDGTFFRILPDLAMAQPFTDETVAALAQLSDTLAEGGTRFVYVPLPTRALAMPAALPVEARHLGYDPALAASLYQDLLVRLGERKIATVDARTALVTAPGAPASFFATDPRLTSGGAEKLAGAIAARLFELPKVGDLPRAKFQTRSIGPVELPSEMRTILQRHCLSPLPLVTTGGFVTSRISLASGSAQGSSPRVVLLSHGDAGEQSSNLAGFLSEASGLDVQHYSVPGGDAFAAISSYLTAPAFRESRPAILVWVNPIHAGLADHGDQPMRELIAAAGPECANDLPIGQGTEPGHLIADLGSLDPAKPGMIMVDTGGSAVHELRLDFTDAGGVMRSRWVTRDPGQIATARFYVPADGLWPGGAVTVDLHIDRAFGPGARVAACPAPLAGEAR